MTWRGCTSVRADWDTTWIQMAETFASSRSYCSRRKASAIIVDPAQNVVAISYNGLPAGQLNRNDECQAWCPRAQDGPATLGYDDCLMIHAEANSLLRADRSRMLGGTIYVNTAVCRDCAKLISNSGLARVVMRVRDDDAHRGPDEVIEHLRWLGFEVVTCA